MTLGKQLLESRKKESKESVETRELATEIYKKKIEGLITKTIQEGIKEYNGKKFYIIWFGYNDRIDPNMAHCKVIGRITRPKPEWRQTVFSYDPSLPESKCFRYEWMLPKKETAMEIMVNPDGFHPHLLENIDKFIKGKLE